MHKTMRCVIHSLAFGGDGVGKIEGKVCFVEGALPGEDVSFAVTKETPKFVKGYMTKIHTSSPDRIKPECIYYEECGGCQLQHLSYEKEVYYKKEQVKELLKRLGGEIVEKDIEITPSERPYNYRTSITLHRSNLGYGFYKRDNRTILPIKKCVLADEHLNKKLPFESAGPHEKQDVTLKSDASGGVWVSGEQGNRFFKDRYRDVEITSSPNIFTQSNRCMAEKISLKLDEWMKELSMPEDSVLFDLYAGNGFFSFIISTKFGMKICVDSDRAAIECAKITVADKKLGGYKFYKSAVEENFGEVFERYKKGFNVILIDPPRQGLDKNFSARLKEIKEAERIYYISCDPACFARDVKILSPSEGKSGWKLNKIAVFDMFPRTSHIEILSEFVRG
ncbi:MAG: class I SAM-dependent RNA methyltransferase [Candidatus Omnitrophica bacterium]|nr:class I SAM-dependent RNA methyltransferase [Candidatus Omnitrophota bacterium]